MATQAPRAKRTRTAAASKPAAKSLPSATHLLALVLAGLLTVAAAGTIAVSLLRDNDASVAEPSAAVSADELVAAASASPTPVYWAGRISGRELELTTTADGTFVRYLPVGVAPGEERRTLTVATYSVADAYDTAKARAGSKGMTSRETRNGGLAVWSRTQPTSVYVAFDGAPQLVEVYAPTAAEARRLALSGRIRPVR